MACWSRMPQETLEINVRKHYYFYVLQEPRSHLHVLINSALEQRVVQTGSGNSANWKCCKLFYLAISYPRNKPKPSHLLRAMHLHCCPWIPAYPGARNQQIPHLAGAVWLNP